MGALWTQRGPGGPGTVWFSPQASWSLLKGPSVTGYHWISKRAKITDEKVKFSPTLDLLVFSPGTQTKSIINSSPFPMA